MSVVNEYGWSPAWVSGVPSGKIAGALKLATPNGSAEPIVVGSVIVTVGAPPPLTDAVLMTVPSTVGTAATRGTRSATWPGSNTPVRIQVQVCPETAEELTLPEKLSQPVGVSPFGSVSVTVTVLP